MSKVEQKEQPKFDPRYPKWKYHASKEALIVESVSEEKSLGDDWKDTPAAFGIITAPSREDLRKLKGLA